MAVSGEPKSRTAKGMKNKFVRLHNAYNKSLDTLHVECHQTLNLLAATIADTAWRIRCHFNSNVIGRRKL